jgi:hypothetical protein
LLEFLPADGIELPFEPNENLGTFSIGQQPIGELAYPRGTILHPNRNCKGSAIGVVPQFDGFSSEGMTFHLAGGIYDAAAINT